MRIRGYIKPNSSFHTYNEWEVVINDLLSYQKTNLDTRGGEISCKDATYCSQEDFEKFVSLISSQFGYLLNIDSPRYELLTQKNVLDFIEDLVNHRFWSLKSELKLYFDDISNLRIGYFYSRGDIEPYILIDENFTTQLYGSTVNFKELSHYTNEAGLEAILNSMDSNQVFDISSFTIAKRPFFDKRSNIQISFIGNVKAGFRSDVKSLVVDSGHRAVNMYRLEYPGEDINNICYELDSCDKENRTSLWNEYIATPIKIENIRRIK